MVDIHHHLLAGLDDGADRLETSIAMAEMAVADGITHVVATPHANHRYAFSPERIAERLAELQESLAARGVPLQLASGCDFHLSYDNLRDALDHPRKYTLNASEYLLIELPELVVTPNLSETLYELRLAGMQPILTHPERHPVLQRDLARMELWVREGLLVQVTAGSVLGRMGPTAERAAHALLERCWVHFLATDAHNVERRPPQMKAARELVARRYGEAYAELLCETNPAAVFEGQDLPPQPEPRFADDDDPEGRPHWWQRLLGRR